MENFEQPEPSKSTISVEEAMDRLGKINDVLKTESLKILEKLLEEGLAKKEQLDSFTEDELKNPITSGTHDAALKSHEIELNRVVGEIDAETNFLKKQPLVRGAD